jgi:putative holliday junction resolvase
MPIIDITQLKSQLTLNSRLLGLDLGDSTIGLALSDLNLMIASPLSTIKRTKFTKDVVELKAIIDKQGVGGLVLGYPINMDNTKGPRAHSTMSFANNLMKILDMPLVLWDERLSTAAVTRTLLLNNTSRAKRDAAIDKMAAGYILQGALDRLSYL